jgi:hypothetical protein
MRGNRAGQRDAHGCAGCTADEAFELLVQASQRENVKLRDVAQRIVDEAVARGRQSKPDSRERRH